MSINNLFNFYASKYLQPQRNLITTLSNKNKALNKQNYFLFLHFRDYFKDWKKPSLVQA